MTPVLSREWKFIFRGNSPYYFLIFYGMLHVLIFLGASMPVLQGSAIFNGALEHTGRVLAGRLYGTQLLLIILSFPSLSVKLMTRDREEEMTRKMLGIIPYENWKMMCWKLIASMIIWGLMMIIILPLFLFSLSMGGISMTELGALIGTLIFFVLMCGGTGLILSLAIHQSEYALAATYFSVFIVVCAAGYLSPPDSIIMRYLRFSF